VQQRFAEFREADAGKATPFRHTTGFDRFSLRIQVECNLQQHPRKSNIVSGLGHLSGTSGSLSEVRGVQDLPPVPMSE
jgi:hypothetical protein